ncbi:MAG: DUF192 domain-containing protein [Eggerthellaceae bacterium]|nr:DUF192 domain-containing protein [Eggerthellaceae bacterium]
MIGNEHEKEAFCLATGYVERLRGLLFTKPQSRPLLLARCRSVHTFGMKHDLDIAFLDREGKVLSSYQQVKPRCFLGEPCAVAVLERFSTAEQSWPQEGEKLFFVVGKDLAEKPNPAYATGGSR